LDQLKTLEQDFEKRLENTAELVRFIGRKLE